MTKKTYPLEHNDPELIKRVKVKALEEGKTIKDIIIDFLKRYIK